MKAFGHGGNDVLRAATSAGPADCVGGHGEDDSEGTAGGEIQRQEGVSGASSEESASGVGSETALDDSLAGLKALEAKPGHEQRMPGETDWAEGFFIG